MSLPPRPWVIAHRGASGLRPEHSRAAYELAIAQGADFIEPDLVMSRDGVLIARHENEISGTTDVADRPEFADRRAERMVDCRRVSGWFVEDFTLAELKTLRARERLPALRPQSAAYDGRFEVLTFDQIVTLVLSAPRPVGIVAELKHPTHLASRGLDMEGALLAALDRLPAALPLYVECFEVGILQRLHQRRPSLRLVQLLEAQGSPPDRPDLSYAQMTTPDGLAHIARYAGAIGPAKALIVPRAADGTSLPATSLVTEAHAAGLQVFSWTFRSENFFLPAECHCGDDPAAHGDAAAEYRAFYDLGIDAVFSDFPADALAARSG